MALSPATRARFDAQTLVNVGPLTTKFRCLISTYKFTALCWLCKEMLQLHSGHMTLLRMEFQPLTALQSDLRRRAASHWALPHISSFC